tara:strand:- start:169 stop:417 length:249 start_codon:yes stop_codon:yes gene_type:complete
MNLNNIIKGIDMKPIKLTGKMIDVELPIEFALVETLNGNYVLKPMSKVKDLDSIEQEFYGTKEEVKKESRKHINELRKEGLI